MNLPDKYAPLSKLFPFNQAALFTIGLLLLLAVTACNMDLDQRAGEPFLLGNGFGFGTSILMVNNLDSVQSYFKDTLGFKTARKARKGLYDGTLSLGMQFPDGSSVMLLSLNDTLNEVAPDSFITSFLSTHEGVRMFALLSSSVDSTYNWLTSRGYAMDSVQSIRTSSAEPEGWGLDDGGPQLLALDFDAKAPPAHLPRFEEMQTLMTKEFQTQWTTLFSYRRKFNQHPNGVVGTSALSIAVEDLDQAVRTYQKMGFTLLGMDDAKTQARFQVVRHQELILRTAAEPDDEIAAFLQARGPGVFAISFDVEDLEATHAFFKEKLSNTAIDTTEMPERIIIPRRYAYGVQLEFVEEPAEQALLAERLVFGDTLTSTAREYAAAMYTKYCALCHGDNREGYAADFAPSLKSHSLLATTVNNNFLRYTIQYGREGTAMAGYLKKQGGPMELIEIDLLLKWLLEESGVEEPIDLSREPVEGDIALGGEIYQRDCAACHGANGEGISAPALGHPMLLATATDGFLQYAIKEGRDGTPMISFKDSLSNEEIDAVTAFLRSRASGWG